MKALTFHQPWASLVAFGEKKIETRSWPTSFRGRLAIHAGKKFGDEEWRLANSEPFRSALARHGFAPNDVPLGCVLAIVELDVCVMSEYARERISEQESAFGNFGPKRYAWYLKGLRKLEEPIPVRGYQGLWDFDSRRYGIL